MALAMAAVTFTSCEDVPAPYDYPGTGGPEGVYLNQSFAKDLGDFKSFGTNDNIAWTIDYSSACITGYKDFNGDGTKTNEAGVTYLVSPEIDLTKASKAYIEMNHAMKYERADVNANNTLLISKDYTDDPTKATWTPIAYPTTGLNDASTKEFVFVTSAANIPAEFIGQKVRIAFRHTCTDKQSSTWEIKTLCVKEGEVENGGGEVTPPAPTGDNLLANGNCETWDGTTPVNWKTTSTAGNASLKQSTDAHGGSYSISVGFNASQNKRLGYKEITLKAGTYKFSFYAKSTTADKSQCRPGYVFVTDGVADKNYNYREDYEPLNNSTWTLVSYEFTQASALKKQDKPAKRRTEKGQQYERDKKKDNKDSFNSSCSRNDRHIFRTSRIRRTGR